MRSTLMITLLEVVLSQSCSAKATLRATGTNYDLPARMTMECENDCVRMSNEMKEDFLR